MHRVLVTDAEQRSSLAVVRSLGRAGYEIEVCSAAAAPLAGASRFAGTVHRVPDPMLDPSGCLAALDDIVRSRGIDILLPMTDVSAALALGLGDDHPDLVIPFPQRDVWSEVADKGRLMEVASQVGVPVPRQVVVHSRTADLGPIGAWSTDTGFPVVLKPHRSAVVSEEGVLSFGVELVASEDELERKIRGFRDEAFPILVQERIEGPGLGAFFLSAEGTVIASFAHRRLREKPPTGGVSVLRESVSMREDLERHSAALLSHFGWSGVAMVEFKEDASTGTPYLMEINGRFWGSLQLAIDSGVDFPVLLLDAFINGHESRDGHGSRDEKPRQETSSYQLGVRSRWLWGDMDHLVWLLRAGVGYRKSDPGLPSRLGGVGRFLVPWSPGQRLEVLRLGDIRPFLRESLQWIRDVLPGRGGS